MSLYAHLGPQRGGPWRNSMTNWTESQRRLFEEITRDLGVSFDARSVLEIDQSVGYVDSPVAVHDFATAVLGAIGMATATVGELRGLGSQAIRLDRRHAGLMLNSVAYHFQAGWQLDISPVHTPVNTFFETRDGRYVVYNGAYAHLREGILQFLSCPGEHDAIAAATAKYDAQELEDQLSELGLCATIVRDQAEWLAHAQGRAITDEPVIELTKIADGDPVPLSDDVYRPLEKVRVLEFARVLAGPTIGRTLAEQGADVIHGRHPYLDHILPFEVETGWGKKAAYLDYTREHDRDLIFKLLETTDVIIDGFRHGALARAGLAVEELTRRNRNLICVEENCYGFRGPWVERRGWEQLAQSCTGLARLHSADKPRLALVPAYLNDYGTGYLGALGAIAALIRRATEGGSWLVRVSLAKTALLATRYCDSTESPVPINQEDLERYLVDQDSRLGLLTRVAPPLEFERTPSMCLHAASAPGSDTLELGWGPDPLSPSRIPHRPTEIFELKQVHWEANQTL